MPLVLLQWIGMNALIVYALAACELFPVAVQGFYWKSPRNNLVFIFLFSSSIFSFYPMTTICEWSDGILCHINTVSGILVEEGCDIYQYKILPTVLKTLYFGKLQKITSQNL